MTHRFVVGPDLALSRGQARQIASVLRLGPGDEIVLLPPRRAGTAPTEIRYRIDRLTRGAVEGTVLERTEVIRDRVRAVELALPLLKGEHSEQILEAATQLDVVRFVPFVSERSVVRDLSPGRRARWQRIVNEAVETSRREDIPELADLVAWEGLFGALRGRVLVAWERERSRALAESVRELRAVSLVIGPEGGLTDDEVALALSKGAVTVSLGSNNLRAETAAVAAVAVAVAR